MSKVLNIFILVELHNIYVTCILPTLSVRKLDQHLIQKERQNNFDMCLLFNSEDEPHTKAVQRSHRSKREAFIANPALDEESARRVESIVDKLYDDALEAGVSYKTKNLKSTTVTGKIGLNVNASRRFDFAPAFMDMNPAGGNKDSFERPEVEEPGDDPSASWHKRWPHAIIPYFIDARTYDTILAQHIRDAFDFFERATCVRLQRLRERPLDQNSMEKVEWLYISNPSGIRQCVHSNENKANKGVQLIVFGYECMGRGEILHELMHVLGFSHEHTRPDRDEHVTILWQNIKPGYRKYFDRRDTSPLLGLPYDYDSVLHYPPRAFSKNGKITISTQDGSSIGQRDGLSATDVQKITKVFGYECKERDKEYLLQTCPTVMKSNPNNNKEVSENEIKNYFKGRLWKYGVVTLKLKDAVEFTLEEKDNIYAVINHIESETCIKFNLIADDSEENNHKNINEAFSDEIQPTTEGKYGSGLDKDDDTGLSGKIDTTDSIVNVNQNVVSSQERVISPSNSDTGFQSSQPVYGVKTEVSEPGEKSPSNSDTGSALSNAESAGGKSSNSEASSGVSKSPPISDKIGDSESGVKSSSNSETGSADKVKEPVSDVISPNNSNVGTPTNGAESLADKASNSESSPPHLPDTAAIFLYKTTELQSDNNVVKSELSSVDKGGISNTNSINEISSDDHGNGGAGRMQLHKTKVVIEKNISKPKKPVSSVIKLKQNSTASRRHSNDFLVLTKSTEPGCVCPPPGRQTNKELPIHADCFNSVNDLLHLFVHVLGLDHQHNMYDRDDFLHVNWASLSPEMKADMKNKLPPAASVGYPYDYQSVMHYPWLQIKNGVTALMYPVWNDGWSMGHWQGLSAVDVKKINHVYSQECQNRAKLD